MNSPVEYLVPHGTTCKSNLMVTAAKPLLNLAPKYLQFRDQKPGRNHDVRKRVWDHLYLLVVSLKLIVELL